MITVAKSPTAKPSPAVGAGTGTKFRSSRADNKPVKGGPFAPSGKPDNKGRDRATPNPNAPIK